jgi:large subunit ribosomal protein L21
VLMVANGDQVNVGSPTVKDAVVGATVIRHTRGDKIMVFRRKRRKNFRRIRGHRQDLTLIQITDIATDGKLKPAAKKAETAKPAAKKAEADKAPAAKKAATAKPAAKKATTSEKPAATKKPAAAKKPAKASAKADKA